MPSTKFEERELEYTPDKPVERLEGTVDERQGQTNAEELVKPLGEYAANSSVSHIGEVYNARDVVH